ncbi:PhoU domain-containing protein [Candidatus Latescibacterota bacterium]
MFGELKRIWAEQSFTMRIVEEFSSMLESSEEMLTYALKVLTQKGKALNVQENIYIKDQKINITEQEIRKRILIRLSTSPGGNIPACLVLISIAKDAERLGDYVKNIFELSNMVFRDFVNDDSLFKQLFETIGHEVKILFESVNTAFKNSDTELALEVSARARNISKQCEDVITQVVNSDFTADQAVVLTLGARYLKRIALHLSNISSSIFLPMPEMDYIKGGIQKK